MTGKRMGRIRLDESRCGQGIQGDNDQPTRKTQADSHIVAQTNGISNLAPQIAIELGSEVAQ